MSQTKYSDGPGAIIHDDPEVVPEASPSTTRRAASGIPSKRLGDMKASTFWLLFCLICVVVIGVTVGGAVGGSIAANKSHHPNTVTQLPTLKRENLPCPTSKADRNQRHEYAPHIQLIHAHNALAVRRPTIPHQRLRKHKRQHLQLALPHRQRRPRAALGRPVIHESLRRRAVRLQPRARIRDHLRGVHRALRFPELLEPRQELSRGRVSADGKYARELLGS
ncbi:hypothetical protein L207DRAFT_535787 [Hyaloscypha variabilis F]|uniref:Uncharacterized protein n=1 Tax=Hyaloscypha variabilis (strain UAMH 11265 / GT02V1 / F) TaxID=1149755 RepID=A0A2J6R3M8_HYAVF|nr:hypothetical protein L207DRAFT_535787 [Hyaloscypha variabilis F]